MKILFDYWSKQSYARCVVIKDIQSHEKKDRKLMKRVSQSLSEKVYDSIKTAILAGELKAGDKISEDRLAEEFGVSRTPIREALQRLSEYGLVSIAKRSHVSVISISAEDAKDIAELRIALEQYAIDRIKPEIFLEHLADITRYAAECQYALLMGDRAKSFELDSLFHVEVIKSTGDSVLTDVYSRLDVRLQLLRVAQNESNQNLLNYLGQHLELIQYIKNGDRDRAKALIREHIMHDGEKTGEQLMA